MEIQNISIPSNNKFVTDYLTNDIDMERFFDYNIHYPSVFQTRKDAIIKRSFPRDSLVEHLQTYNQRFNCSEKTVANINKLKDQNSVAVIGGQQAGILTGPLYTIHKLVSILKLAEQQERELNCPVVPIFWVAGEDHDFAEINHVYIAERALIKKKMVPHQQQLKKSVSNIEMDKEICLTYIQGIFESYGETEFTNELLHKLNEMVNHATTYVDLFVSIITELFGEYGVVMVDSGSEELRKIESDYFKTMIESNKEIHDSVMIQQQKLQDNGYHKIIEMQPKSANLFYHLDGERILLEYCPEEKVFRGKSNECEFTADQLLDIAEHHPEKLSNNVVTRPLMQEFLFPTLAFISGPGEVAYWAELKEVFSLFNLQMPPVVPRIMITLIERNIDNDLKELNLPIETVLTSGVTGQKEQWIKAHTSFNVDEIVDNVQSEVELLHKQIRVAALKIDESMEGLLLKNASIIQSQFNFVKNTINKQIENKHQVELNKFSKIEMSLYPNSSPQERVWNIFYYLNRYGLDFVHDMMKLTFVFDWEHKIIKV